MTERRGTQIGKRCATFGEQCLRDNCPRCRRQDFLALDFRPSQSGGQHDFIWAFDRGWNSELYLIASCVQPRQASGSEPPSTSYQVRSFEFQNNGNSQKVRGASVTPAFFQSAEVAPLVGRGLLPEEYSSR